MRQHLQRKRERTGELVGGNRRAEPKSAMKSNATNAGSARRGLQGSRGQTICADRRSRLGGAYRAKTALIAVADGGSISWTRCLSGQGTRARIGFIARRKQAGASIASSLPRLGLADGPACRRVIAQPGDNRQCTASLDERANNVVRHARPNHDWIRHAPWKTGSGDATSKR